MKISDKMSEKNTKSYKSRVFVIYDAWDAYE